MPSVLIVDDEPMICTYLAMHFRSEGYDTLSAADGLQGLQICKAHQPNIIISDIKMPGCDGVEFVRGVQTYKNYNPVILYMTAYSDVTLETAYEMGVDALFKKPFKIKDILGAIKKFLKIKEALSQVEIQKKLNEEQLSTNAQLKLLAELSAGISHNINNHISYITTSSYILRKYLENSYDNLKVESDHLKMIKIADKIHSHALMTYRIVKSMKMLARQNSREDERENVPILSIIQSSFDLLEEDLKLKSIQCTISCAENIYLHCYPEQILQVFVNLIQNSCDALDSIQNDNKWIKIEATKKETSIDVSFTDSGLGIAENVRSHIMEAFFTTKNRGKGTGVGLSLSKRIMESQEGTLCLDESSKNTRFVASFKLT